MQDYSKLPYSSIERTEEREGITIDLRAPLRFIAGMVSNKFGDGYAPGEAINPKDVSLVRQCRVNDTQWGSWRPRGSQLQRKVRRPALDRFSALRDALHKQWTSSCMGLAPQLALLRGEYHYVRTPVGRQLAVVPQNIESAIRMMNAVADVVVGNGFTKPLHPAVEDALRICAPRSMRVLLMHCPTPSEDEPGKLAYFQTLYKASTGLRTRTTVGKYLREYFPQLTDTEVRDIVARHTITGDRFGIVDNMDGMINVLVYGPSSCMRGTADDFDIGGRHPYEVYAPTFGWAMAYMTAVDHTPHHPQYDARALVNKEKNIFVRTYKRDPNGGYSYASEELHQWLISQGFEHASGWDGCKLARIAYKYGGYVMPYIDGQTQGVYAGAVDWLTVGKTPLTPNCVGEADNTNGLIAARGRYTCACCDASGDDGFLPLGGEHSSRDICAGCYSSSSSSTSTPYVVVHSGDYVIDRDEAVYLDGYGWYATNDDDVFYCDYAEEYVHIDDTWTCDFSDERFADSVTATDFSDGTTVADHKVDDYLKSKIRNSDYDHFVEYVNDCGCSDLTRSLLRLIDQIIDDDTESFPWDEEGVVDAYRELCNEFGQDPRDPPSADTDTDEDEAAA